MSIIRRFCWRLQGSHLKIMKGGEGDSLILGVLDVLANLSIECFRAQCQQDNLCSHTSIKSSNGVALGKLIISRLWVFWNLSRSARNSIRSLPV